MTRLGLWGARGDRRGLHIQAAEFCRHMNPVKVMGFDLLRTTGSHTPPCDWSDYRGSELTVMPWGKAKKPIATQWLEGLDVVWACETFYQDAFPEWAREVGVKTIQHVNPEFYRYLMEPNNRGLVAPDVVLSPSKWRLDKMPGARELICPVALDRLEFEHRPLELPLTFLHVVGTPASEDRNGSHIVRDALEHVQEPCRLLVRAQRAMGIKSEQIGKVTIEVIRADIEHYWELYEQGDVMLLPRRYGGQCLPVFEAAACGIPTVMTDCCPQNGWLPPEQLIPTVNVTQMPTQAGLIDLHHADPRDLAAKMDQLSRDAVRVSELSENAREWAEARSWKEWEPEYRAVIADALGLTAVSEAL